MWSRKQRQVFRSIVADPKAETIIIPGPTQSGKSVSGVYAFMTWASQSAGQEFIIGSHTQRQLESSVLRHMRDWALNIERQTGQPFMFRRQGEHYLMDSAAPGLDNPEPNTFYPVLGSNAGAEGRARSFSVLGALVDEATLWPESALNQIIARCSGRGAKACMITNPAGPLHPLKVKYIDGGELPYVVHIPFALDDNPTLTERYKARIRQAFRGADRMRMVDGEWAAMEGAVYPFFSEALGEPPADAVPSYYTASGDYGGSNATCVGLWAHYVIDRQPVSWLVKEWYHDGKRHGTMKVADQARRVARELFGGLPAPLRRVSIDQSAHDFIVELRHRGLPVQPADNTPGTLIPSIQLTRTHLERGLMMISRRCVNTMRSMSNYIWDPNSLIDRPLKQDDHAADMVRYEAWAQGGQQARDRRRSPRRIAR